ncbi:MAG: PaaI family thioesterase [Magnetospiraceae bacterium]
MIGCLTSAPIYKIENVKKVGAEQGRTEFHAVATEDHYNPIRSAHGGWVATVLDNALASCVHTAIPQGSGFVTIEFKVNIIGSVTSRTSRLTCEGKLVHIGRSVATSEAKSTGPDGKLIAHGVETCSIFPLP